MAEGTSDQSIVIDAAEPAWTGMPGEGMRMLGWIIGLAGLLAAGIGVLFATTVHVDAEYTLGHLEDAKDVINLGLQQNRLMIYIGGMTGLACGCLLYAAGTIVLALYKLNGKVTAD